MNDVRTVVILDFDGVIVTLDIDWSALRKEISAALNIQIDTFATFFAENFGKSEFERVSEKVRKAELSAAENADLYPDVRPALELLRSHGIQTFIASMQSIDVLNSFLQKYGIHSFFVQVLGRESGGSKQAELEQIKQISQKREENHQASSQLVLIDDAKRNTVIASELGYNSILFKRSDGVSLVDTVKSILEKKA